MKRAIFGILIISCLAFALPANSQIKFGFKFGTNFTNNNYDAMIENIKELSSLDLKIKGTTGIFFGPMMDVKLPILGFGFDAGFNYNFRKYTIDVSQNNNSEVTKQHSFVIPVNLKYNFGLGDVIGLYVTAGPTFEFNINPDSFWKDVTVAAANAIDGYEYERKSTDIWLSVGAGLKILNHVQFGFNYNFGLTEAAKGSVTNLVNAAWDNKAIRNREWQISAAYLF